jgi:hypothetical protein
VLHVEKRRPAPLNTRMAASGAANDTRETTMPKYLLHDEYTPPEPTGGRS